MTYPPLAAARAPFDARCREVTLGSDDLPEVTAGAEKGWGDLDFKLTRVAPLPGGRRYLEGHGLHEGKRVGFAVTLGGRWSERPMEEAGGTFYEGRATLLSIGPESDRMVAVLDKLYGTNLGAGGMRHEIEVSAVGLLTDPRLLDEQPVRMKLFFNADPEGRPDYAEAFLNVAVPEGTIQFHEKDHDYRGALIRALSEKAG
jgi:hypothetical protein